MILRSNAKQGQACEARVARHLLAKCSAVERVRRGADFKCTMPSGRVSYHEAKSGHSQLTPTQQQLACRVKHYVVHRCSGAVE
jgi:hypothetical protein